MSNFLHRVKFLLTASNQHGVHSPFIYSYVTKCLYALPDYSCEKSKNVLFKSIDYFAALQVGFAIGAENIPENIQIEIAEKFPSVQLVTFREQGHSGPYDIIFFTDVLQAGKGIRNASQEKTIHNDTLVLINGIHATTSHLSLWEKIKDYPSVTVTVDMFHCGAVFFRKEQAKEHFKIRL